MANGNVFRGSDGTLLLAVDNGPGGDAGKPIIDENQFSSVVARVTNVDIHVESELKPFHEMGKRYPTELRPGNINIWGSVERAAVNGALLKLLLGDGAGEQIPSRTFVQPSFNMVVILRNPAVPNASSTVTLNGVRFENWNYALPEDDFVMESLRFQALSISIKDEEPKA